MNVEPEILALAALVVCGTSVVQGAIGFGANLLAAPILALLDTDLVPGPVFLAGVIITIGGALRERPHIDGHVVGWASIGRVPGVVVGGVVLAAVSDTSLQVLVGITILVAVGLSMAEVALVERRATWLVVGAVSGFGATTAAIGGPPIALALQHRPGAAVRSTMSMFFVVGTFFTLPAMALAGRFGGDELAAGLVMAPAALLGFTLSSRLRGAVDAGRLRPLVLAVSGLAGVALLVRVAA